MFALTCSTQFMVTSGSSTLYYMFYNKYIYSLLKAFFFKYTHILSLDSLYPFANITWPYIEFVYLHCIHTHVYQIDKGKVKIPHNYLPFSCVNFFGWKEIKIKVQKTPSRSKSYKIDAFWTFCFLFLCHLSLWFNLFSTFLSHQLHL